MKANGLTIGDWVYDRRDDLALTEINPMRVTGIIKNGAFCQFGNDSYTITVSIDYIAPILLTAEILKKNGFIRDGESWWYLNFRIVLSTSKGFSLVCGRLIKFAYVHELQHALRLCGIDKEIEL